MQRHSSAWLRRAREATRIAFESMPAQCPPDDSPFEGLPDDRCQCPHLGYVIAGSFRVTYRDGREEVVRPGEAYHLEPGHFVQTLELGEFSPRTQKPEHIDDFPVHAAIVDGTRRE